MKKEENIQFNQEIYFFVQLGIRHDFLFFIEEILILEMKCISKLIKDINQSKKEFNTVLELFKPKVLHLYTNPQKALKFEDSLDPTLARISGDMKTWLQNDIKLISLLKKDVELNSLLENAVQQKFMLNNIEQTFWLKDKIDIISYLNDEIILLLKKSIEEISRLKDEIELISICGDNNNLNLEDDKKKINSIVTCLKNDVGVISHLNNDIKAVYKLINKLCFKQKHYQSKKYEWRDSQLERLWLDLVDDIIQNKRFVGFQNKDLFQGIALNKNYPLYAHDTVCHEMFKSALAGYSKMYIQMPDLKQYKSAFESENDINSEKKVVLLQCSLITMQMLSYDDMMFAAMKSDNELDYKENAIKNYRPYFFSFVAELDRNKYEILEAVQRDIKRNHKNNGDDSYVWMECTSIPQDRKNISLDGYVVQSASPVVKINRTLHILSGVGLNRRSRTKLKSAYKIVKKCQEDSDVIGLIDNYINSNYISSIYIYKVGNGNCIFVNIGDAGEGFFYDIGFNYKHKPTMLIDETKDDYSKNIHIAAKNKPSFLILSHWDMDHILGISAAGYNYFDVDWFAPDCQDACLDAKRLAKFLDQKNHLFRLKRKLPYGNGRLIGKPIVIFNSRKELIGQYKLYMGEKADCDSSSPNCEGIVIEYTCFVGGQEKVILMMGDVNYASFNKARQNSGELVIADTHIDYLIVPHHGSGHTDYIKLTAGRRNKKKVGKAIICCVKDIPSDRPNKEHLEELHKRFKKVVATEEAKKPPYIRIPL